VTDNRIMVYLLVTLCCVFASLGSFLFGYDAGVISSTIEQSAFLNRFSDPSDSAIGGIVASYNGTSPTPFTTIHPL
jgi:hypothetical protein